MSHRFKLRQRVRLARHGVSDSRVGAGDVYEIVRLMPADTSGEPSYRIRSSVNERAVRESEIAPAS